MEEFEDRGHFWIPERDQDVVAGILRFERGNGPRLDLIGQLGSGVLGGEHHIVGHAGDGPVTLTGCYCLTQTLGFPGIGTETWRPRFVLRGCELRDAGDLEFDAAVVEIDAMLEWTNRTRITRRPSADDSAVIGIDVALRAPSQESVTLDDGGALEIRFPWATEGDNVRWSTVRQRCVLRRSWATPQRLDTILQEIQLFSHLLTLATNRACGSSSITLEHPEVCRNGRPAPISLYAQPVGPVLDPVPSRTDMWFGLDDLGGIQGLKRWRNTALRYRQVLGYATSIRLIPTMFADTKLTNVVTALELLHRPRYRTKAIEDEDFRALRHTMLNSIDAQWRNHLGAQLRHANEHFLTTRLIQLAELSAPASTAIVGEHRTWARVMTRVRNDLTHPDDAGQHQEEKPVGSDLYLLAESGYQLLVVALLHEAGATSQVLQSIATNPHLEWLADELRPVLTRLTT